MNDLLIFFAFPVATIILAAVLQTILHSPTQVSAVFFSIFLVITFAFFDTNFLIATIIYTILAFLSAFLMNIIRKIVRRLCTNNNNNNDLEEMDEENSSNSTNTNCGFRIKNESFFNSNNSSKNMFRCYKK